MFFYSVKFGPSADHYELYFYHKEKFSRNEFIEIYNTIIHEMDKNERYYDEYKNFTHWLKLNDFVPIEPHFTIYNESEIMEPISEKVKNKQVDAFIKTN
ncbi:hypothetical protein ABEP16_13175 [Priestia aryabhattai]|uniref:hypothetical protein n=1 Tax=Priestia aryabhattai TaxID=412384 RepID=UPI003D2C908F